MSEMLSELEPHEVGIVYYSCNHNVTRGHKRMLSNVRRACVLAGIQNFQFTLRFDAKLINDTIDRMFNTSHVRRVLLINDFPDFPLPSQMTLVLDHLKVINESNDDELRVQSIYIAMVASAEYRAMYTVDGRKPFPYSAVVSVEPGACRHVVEHQSDGAICRDADFKIAPLIDISLAPTEQDVRVWTVATEHMSRPVLWIPSGTKAEAEQTYRWLQRKHKSTIVTPGLLFDVAAELGLEISRAPLFTKLANEVICAPGYSTFWELYALDTYSKVIEWLQLPRPVEGIAERVRVLTKPTMLRSGTCATLRTNPLSGIQALSHIITRMSGARVPNPSTQRTEKESYGRSSSDNNRFAR